MREEEAKDLVVGQVYRPGMTGQTDRSRNEAKAGLSPDELQEDLFDIVDGFCEEGTQPTLKALRKLYNIDQLHHRLMFSKQEKTM